MTRQILIDLFRRGMRYPPGTYRRLRLTRWFDISVQPSQHVEITEYEEAAVELPGSPAVARDRPGSRRRVGRTRLDLKTCRVVEHHEGEP